MLLSALRRCAALICLLAAVGPLLAERPAPAPVAQALEPAAPQPSTVSYWGMNAYLTKLERLNNDRANIPLLTQLAKDAGVQWTREEFTWAHVEPANNSFSTMYDEPLRAASDSGLGIVGMLLTTPTWARDPACAPNEGGDRFWCPPADVNEYAQFATWMVERYDGDGFQDAPGSPRVAAWELWNEPNDTWLWPRLGTPEATGERNRRIRYGQLMVAGYNAIKAADPTALVLTGGIYVFDGETGATPWDGLRFLQRLQNTPADGVFDLVPQARQAFDVLSIHPYVPTAAPDGRQLVGDNRMIGRLYTIEGRVRTTRAWLNDPRVNRPGAPIWITEIGWCTATGACPGGAQVSEEQQANYLVRSLVIAQQGGVQHASWFQLEDAFNDPNRLWANAAILRNFNASQGAYPLKQGYVAYQNLSGQLNGAAPLGPGPAHTHVYDPERWYTNDNGTYDYAYSAGPHRRIDVLWIPSTTGGDPASRAVAFPVNAGWSVKLVNRSGQETALTPAGGAVQLTLTESPVYVVQSAPPVLQTNPSAATGLWLVAERGAASRSASIAISNGGGGTLSWGVTTNVPGGGYSADPTGGTAPGITTITVALQNREPGTYAGAANFNSNGGVVSVPVRLVITATLRRVYLPQLAR
ncbi:MAG TPA: cellulase family glycosylhydrolase [Herpetosiphonaceae bacterium]